MTRSEQLDKLNMLAEALSALLNVYREDIKGILFMEIVDDGMPDHWTFHNVGTRGDTWLSVVREARARVDIDEELEEGDTARSRARKRHLQAISVVAGELACVLDGLTCDIEATGEEE
nr:MAG TPA: hypothetical protein [Caudoviricetes sp.]